MAADWAYMIPIVELARKPVEISRTLYLYEPGGVRDARYRRLREAEIARIIKKPALAAGQEQARKGRGA